MLLSISWMSKRIKYVILRGYGPEEASEAICCKPVCEEDYKKILQNTEDSNKECFCV